ncbi:hypothetical protein D6D21_03160 [Aureobasidium pullulans]|uniref:Azaphilone pigments biosynthesis cluster protein L N-terminal domain-containing protein n=1 Tax=Aureobasidium pullulans TaxID=5580 RepID=A0AB74J3G6_AURPU|nr:hypothetical protein D6D21_03160 [Aureobasidium pullulans]
MADPLSITAGVLGIAATAAHSIHLLVELIDRIKDAPIAVQRSRDDLKFVESVIHTLRSELDGIVNAAKWEQLIEASKLKQALKSLKGGCDSLNLTLMGLTKRSAPGEKLSFRDGVNLVLHSSKLDQLSLQLSSCKQNVLLAISACNMKLQLETAKSMDHMSALRMQEVASTKLSSNQKVAVANLLEQEKQLQLIKTNFEADSDFDEADRVASEMKDISRARIAISQFSTVSEYIAKSSIATRTNQDIGKVVIADLGYAAVGISNVEEIETVKQKIGDVSVGSGGTGFIGIHGKVDHNAALAGRWTSGNKS